MAGFTSVASPHAEKNSFTQILCEVIWGIYENHWFDWRDELGIDHPVLSANQRNHQAATGWPAFRQDRALQRGFSGDRDIAAFRPVGTGGFAVGRCCAPA